MNNQIELDHVFCFSSPLLPEVDMLSRYQFLIGLGRNHPGQGTANRCVMFKKNYLELIYLYSEDESKKNQLKLYRRANWKQTGASPFGIALRGTLSTRDLEQFISYKPDYLQTGTILIHKHDDRLPLIFLMPYPVNKNYLDQNFIDHPNGSDRISFLSISGPNYHWPLETPLANTIIKHDDKIHMEIKIQGYNREAFLLNDIVEISPSTN